jgi:PAS domain S-box-containing protein
MIWPDKTLSVERPLRRNRGWFNSATANKSEEQKGAEAEVDGFRKDLGPFVVAAETTRMAIVFTDAKETGNPIIFANDSLLALTGYNREELLGQSINFLVEGGADPETRAQIDAVFGDRADTSAEICCRRKDGSTFWAAMFGNPVRDRTGEVVQHFASFVDTSKHRHAEDRLRFLLDELNHRTQNTLATVQAIALQTLRGHADKEVVAAFEGRILALSKAHSLLGRETWTAVGLRELLDQILLPFGLKNGGAARFSVEGPAVRLQPKAALTLAMVFHELATNAAKHGALSESTAGKIGISWLIEPTPKGERMQLRWQESGGPPVAPPGRKGLGSRLIEGGLAQELEGEVRFAYEPSGVVCQIVMPLPHVELDRSG